MKKSTIRRLLVLCLCLTLVTVSLIGGTLAKFTTTFTASQTVNVASWSIEVKDDGTGATAWTNDSKTFDLGVTANNDVLTNSTIAPGSKGAFGITLTNNGEIDASYTVTFKVTSSDTTAGVPSNLKFKVNNTALTASGEGVYTAASAATLNYGSTGNSATVVVDWEWEYTDTDENAFADDTLTVEVTVTANQVSAAPATSNG